jgi:pyruvate dehydrogenase E2 component (dihydrolipoamide acetyltransferase)
MGNVGKWKKKEGDAVAAGDVLCDIETDKATLDLECMEDGILAKIICPAGTKDVPVGKPLCIVAESKDGLENFASYKGDGASAGGASQAAPMSAPPPPPKEQAPAPSPSPASSPSPPPPSDLPPHEVLAMPALSPTMTQGNVGNWKKKEGDKVAAGDVLCDIETDKATLDFESLEDGVLAKILMPAGSKDVPVGKALCVIAESDENLSKFSNYSQGGGGGGGGGGAAKAALQASPLKQQSAPAKAAPAQKKKAPPVDLPAHQVLAMPALSPTMTQGNVGTWKKKEGEQVAAGDVLCDIETDKATLDFESLEDGYMAKIMIPSGTKDVQVGMELCIIAETNEDLGKFASYSGGASASDDAGAPEAANQPSSAPTSAAAPAVETGSAGQGRIGPAVKKLLAETGLSASQIKGTGPRGAVLKGDVLAAAKGGMKPQAGGAEKTTAAKKPSKAGAATPDSPLSFEDIPNSAIRKIIAKRLLESKIGTPHAYLQSGTLLDPTLKLRKELKEKHGISVSVNDFVIKAAAMALSEVPEANAFWDDKVGDRVNNKSIDISIAVATDKGLITPIVKNADQKSLSTISAEVKSLAEKARQGKLKPHEFQGGTFSISNLGMFQVDHFCAIINPPQACILAVGRGVQKVVYDEDTNGPKTVTEMLVTISVDHRVYDGDTGGRFLAAFRKNLSNPQRMLL